MFYQTSDWDIIIACRNVLKTAQYHDEYESLKLKFERFMVYLEESDYLQDAFAQIPQFNGMGLEEIFKSEARQIYLEQNKHLIAQFNQATGDQVAPTVIKQISLAYHHFQHLFEELTGKEQVFDRNNLSYS